jgi:hypothetical protein
MDRILLDDSPNFYACVGAETLDLASYFNKWNGYIYDLHIFSALGTMQYKTVGCNDACGQCPLNSDCLLAVDFDSYDDATCDASCNDIGCRRAGRCQTCTFDHCHMCADYYCQ